MKSNTSAYKLIEEQTRYTTEGKKEIFLVGLEVWKTTHSSVTVVIFPVAIGGCAQSAQGLTT